jgi:radial spoke head protein 9
LVNRDTSYFLGDPTRKLNVVAEGEGEGAEGDAPADGEGAEGEEQEEDDKSEEEEIKVPPKDLTELDRLKYVTLAIENDCQIAPVGAFKMTAQHQVRRNEAFKGLDSSSSTDLNCYLHFRNV